MFKTPGRMISLSKSQYSIQHPGHVCVFNANVCVRSRGKIWYGDLDVTADEADLKALAQEVGEPVYVLREYDARFENETAPKFENAVACFYPDGSFQIYDKR
jgi:hypothetical protein